MYLSFLVIQSVMTCTGAEVIHNFKGHDLTEVPWTTVWDNCTKLILWENNLVFVIVPGRLKLEHLDLRNNRLTTFPVLGKSAGTLKLLYVDSNHITMVEPRIFSTMPALETLSLGGNPIKIVPDLRPLKSLRKLFLHSMTAMNTHPNMCLLDPSTRTSGTLQIYTKFNLYECTKRLRGPSSRTPVASYPGTKPTLCPSPHHALPLRACPWTT